MQRKGHKIIIHKSKFPSSVTIHTIQYILDQIIIDEPDQILFLGSTGTSLIVPNHALNCEFYLLKVSANLDQPDQSLFSEEGLPVTITALSMLASGPQMCEFFKHVRTGNN